MTQPKLRIPKRLEGRPTDKRGLPYPFVAAQGHEGTGQDFKLNDLDLTMLCYTSKLCGLCGQRLSYWMYFIGGPKSTETRVYTDPAMHEECARYALQTCPYLAAPKYRRTVPKDTPGVLQEPGGESETRTLTGLGWSRGYTVIPRPGRQPLIRANPLKGVEWWHEGKRMP